MGNSKYYYNPETCHYERAKISIWNIVWYSLGLVVVAGLMLTGLVVISEQLMETKRATSLKQENNALSKHKVILTSQLQGIESSLRDLREQDHSLHVQLFEELDEEKIKPARNHSNDILLANPDEYTQQFNDLKTKTDQLFNRTSEVNSAFGQRVEIKSKDAAQLESIPTLPPLSEMNTKLMVSGFGTRINPFHKGKYSHPGLDLAAPRGTVIHATAPGKVTRVNRSSLQAGYGNYVEIDHGNGFITRYAHMDDILVKPGQHVTKKEDIGYVGSTGGSIVPHLHYEIIQQGDNVDPMIYMIEGLSSEDYNVLMSLSKKSNQSLD